MPAELDLQGRREPAQPDVGAGLPANGLFVKALYWKMSTLRPALSFIEIRLIQIDLLADRVVLAFLAADLLVEEPG